MSSPNTDLCRWCNKSRDFNHTFTAGYCLDNDGSVIYEHRFEVTPPSPQPAPQEIEKEQCNNCDKEIMAFGPSFSGYVHKEGGQVSCGYYAEPKPAPQEIDCCKGLAPTHECYINCGGTKPNPIPQPAPQTEQTFEEWWALNFKEQLGGLIIELAFKEVAEKAWNAKGTR